MNASPVAGVCGREFCGLLTHVFEEIACECADVEFGKPLPASEEANSPLIEYMKIRMVVTTLHVRKPVLGEIIRSSSPEQQCSDRCPNSSSKHDTARQHSDGYRQSSSACKIWLQKRVPSFELRLTRTR
jgi:hypothetical protein